MKAHVKLVNLDRLLKGTNWAAAPACIVLVGEVDILIARLFNKAEQAFLRTRDEKSTAAPAEGSPASSSDEHADQGEIAPPGQDETK